MPDVLEAVTNVFKSFADDEPKPPLTVVETSNSWLYYAFLHDALGVSQAALNTTTVVNLSEAIHEELIKVQMTELQTLLVEEGVPLPPASEQKPKCKSDDIPQGVKMTDYEIANELSLKIATAVVTCATVVSESIRNDVGILFARFLSQKIAYGTNLKTLMKKRGWLKVPPYYTPSGTPNA